MSIAQCNTIRYVYITVLTLRYVYITV